MEDAEIIGDEEDEQIIKRNKAQFQVRQLEVGQRGLPSKSSSAMQSKQKPDANNPESDTESQSENISKIKENLKHINLLNEGSDDLRRRLLCISCEEKPKCKMI